ncbi:RICIN domain-containing protein [Kitasatospora sp. NPDC048540]|uniref:RICIN domain-containing protein n=1 Tax=unclassified Kitasatospora TaxID=2633591 RepID=UPI000539EAD2|nr:RICIN domain-containing protein [Kitasatospora sp. MBT63]
MGRAAQGRGPVADGRYRLRNVGSGLLLEVAGGSNRHGAKVRHAPDDGTDAQVWRISAVHPGSGLCHLENAVSGKRLDVTGARTDDGVPLQQWSANAFGAQEWLFERHVDAPGTFTVTAFVSGKVMEAAEDGSVRQWEDTDTPAQWWRLEPA